MDENANDRQSCRYKIENDLYNTQTRAFELDGVKRKGLLIEAHLKLGYSTKTCMSDILRQEDLDWEVMDADNHEVK